MPAFLVPRSLVRRLDRLMRSAEPSSSDRAMERVYAEALTLGLDALAAELEIVRPTNDLGPGVSRALPRPTAKAFTRLRELHVPARILRALRVVTAAGVADPERFPNAAAVHAEALRRGVALLEEHPALFEVAHDRRSSRRRPVDVAEAIGAQLEGRCRCAACAT